MGNFTASRPYIYVAGNIIDPNQNNPNETTIYGQHNASMSGTTGHGHSGATGDGPKISSGGIDLTANYPWTGLHSFAATTTFAGGITGDVAFDTNTLFVDSVNNKVLVGSISSISPTLFQVRKASVGSATDIYLSNTDNTNSSSHAQMGISVGGSSAGDPILVFDIFGVSDWYAGVDNSDLDKFKIGTGGIVGATTALTIDTSLNATFAGTLGSGAITSTGSLTSTSISTGAITSSSTIQGARLISTVAIGTAPLTVTSTTQVTNLNAQFVGGKTEATLALSASQITSGTLPVARGGTGVTTSTGSGNTVLSAAPTLSGAVSFSNGTSLLSSVGGDLTISSGVGDIVLSAGGFSSIDLTDGAGSGGFRPLTDNHIFLGNSGNRWKEVWAVNGVIQTSDKTEKKNIKRSDLGLSFINDLTPVSYKWKKGSDKKTHYGLIAQEVESVLDGKDFSGLYNDLNGPMGLNYSEFIGPMVKAIQELSKEVTYLRSKICD